MQTLLRPGRLLLTAVLIASLLVAGGPEARAAAPPASGILVDPSQGLWFTPGPGGELRAMFYGNPGDTPFVGDWDCDGVDSPGMYRPSDGYVYLRNSNTQGVADIEFFFGNPGDIPLAGDFNGDGCDTLSLYRRSEARVYIINRLGEDGGGLGEADFFFTYGNPDDIPFVGDFDGCLLYTSDAADE